MIAINHEKVRESEVKDWLKRTKLRLSPPTKHGTITLDFGAYHPMATGPGHTHSGIDIGRVVGQQVLAPADMIIRSNKHVSKGGGYIRGELFCPFVDTIFVRMFHLSQRFDFKTGGLVRRGQPIAMITGNSGTNSTGPHIHFEVTWCNWRSSYAINPRLIANREWRRYVNY